MSNISLSSGVRSNLSTLQSTAATRSQVQSRLATGKKVNSALDNATNFFTAAGLNNRASDLSNLLDGISNGIQTIQAADKGITGITKLIQSAQAKLKEGLQSAASTPNAKTGTTDVSANLSKSVSSSSGGLSFGTAASVLVTHGTTTSTVTVGSSDTLQDVIDHVNNALNDDGLLSVNSSTGKVTVRNNTNKALSISLSGAKTGKAVSDLFGSGGLNTVAAGTGPDYSDYIKSYNQILTQIDGLAQDSSFNGKNLLNGDNITITFNEKSSNQNKLDVTGVDDSSGGLGLSTLTANSSTTASALHGALTNLSDALTTIRGQSSKLSANLSIVQTRQDFTKDLVSTLQTGADNLTLADSNEEGANLLALNTRAQLATTALSFSSQADQQVLQFLR